MGLPMRERRKLRKIERAIARTEPRLTAMFSMFTCLNRVEAMPRLERVRNRVIRRAARARRAVTIKTNAALTQAMTANCYDHRPAITCTKDELQATLYAYGIHIKGKSGEI